QLILETSDSNSIRRAALQEGMITLRRDGIYKVLLGLTTVEEILSITSQERSASLPASSASPTPH
ncbi:MAG: type II secretion system protein GspE, partial [bacterium]